MQFTPDTATFLMIVLIGTACAYFIGVAMNGVMEADGFGTTLNTMILVAGGFIGNYVADYLHIAGGNDTWRAVAVVSGGFTCLALLAVLKALGHRLGY